MFLSLPAGEDYSPVNFEVVFTTDVTSSQVCIPVIIFNDIVAENSETFPVVIVSVSEGATLGAPNITTVSITDDDGEESKY